MISTKVATFGAGEDSRNVLKRGSKLPLRSSKRANKLKEDIKLFESMDETGWELFVALGKAPKVTRKARTRAGG